MTKQKIVEVIAIYRKYFEENKIGKINPPYRWQQYKQPSILEHCHGMLDKMEKMIEENRLEKVFRWLGFIQGCLWTLGRYTLDTLKEHNRS